MNGESSIQYSVHTCRSLLARVAEMTRFWDESRGTETGRKAKREEGSCSWNPGRGRRLATKGPRPEALVHTPHHRPSAPPAAGSAWPHRSLPRPGPLEQRGSAWRPWPRRPRPQRQKAKAARELETEEEKEGRWVPVPVPVPRRSDRPDAM